jgi:hypothetical protein
MYRSSLAEPAAMSVCSSAVSKPSGLMFWSSAVVTDEEVEAGRVVEGMRRRSDPS